MRGEMIHSFGNELGGKPMEDHKSDSLIEGLKTSEVGSDLCHTDSNTRISHHSEQTKSKLVARLNRIEGQIRGVKGMIEKDIYCDDVLNQIAAIQSAMNGVGKLLLEGHMRSCVVDRIEAGDHEVIDELLITVNKLMR